MAKPATAKPPAAVEQPVAQTQVVPILTEVKPIPFKLEELMAEHKSKSGVIRFLASKDFTRGQIAKFMGIKYQFVRNVLITPVKKTA